MRALTYSARGPEPLRVVELPEPEPGPRQLLLEVLAASINPVDWKMRKGPGRWLLARIGRGVPGFDVCGRVLAAGEGATRFRPGDEVIAMLDSRTGGAFAERAVVGEAAAARRPASLDPEHAAALPLAGLTALQALRDRGGLRAGMRALVIGASGGVGHLAVQIARALDARVDGVCGTEHVDLVRELGAEHVVDYRREPLASAPGPYDVVLDAVSRASLRELAPLVAPGGSLVCTLPRLDRLLAGPFLAARSRLRASTVLVRPSGDDLAFLVAHAEQGRLTPRIARVLPLERAAEAFRESREGHVGGKLVLRVSA